MKALTCTIKDARVSIPVNSIVYLEGDGNYTYIYVEKKKRIYLARTMKSVLAEIADDSFIRIHKTYAVNKAFIKSMDEFKVELEKELDAWHTAEPSNELFEVVDGEGIRFFQYHPLDAHDGFELIRLIQSRHDDPVTADLANYFPLISRIIVFEQMIDFELLRNQLQVLINRVAQR